MEVGRTDIFNLWNTNGRRADIINAIGLYLRILKKLQDEYPKEKWGNYPRSLAQYRFYKAAIELSPEVFKEHKKIDKFEQEIEPFREQFMSLDASLNLPDTLSTNLDQNIEARARHYTSNLSRLGFTDNTRAISLVGHNFITEHITKDPIENILPLSTLNIIILRQLLKLRIYTNSDENGDRYFYSPCRMAFYLLLNYQNIDKDQFRSIVQGINPYWLEKGKKEDIINNILDISDFVIDKNQIPVAFLSDNKLSRQEFSQHIKNRKSKKAIKTYYDFYSSLYEYRINPSEKTYSALTDIFLTHKNKLNKAFGLGKNIFDVGNRTHSKSYSAFKEANNGHPLLVGNYNQAFYCCYCKSKHIDTAYEYSDTTMRLLSATGVFCFSRALPEISFKNIFALIFNETNLKNSIFGKVSSQEFDEYEKDLSSQFYNEISLCEILGLSTEETKSILAKLGKDETSIKQALETQKENELKKHIKEKYPKEKTMEILNMFSDRGNDQTIKNFVNESATVPTIYEYIMAIAWYYISGENINIYNALNLTLNGDLEPITHAVGGAGDIVVEYPDMNLVVMLEVTLMNKAAQKRGEWEPVLRHSINLNVEKSDQKVITLFVADELDANTINIWRAVSSVPLESSNAQGCAEHIVIMPFTNTEIYKFLSNGTSHTTILDAIQKSYDEINTTIDITWRTKILQSLQ